ncbi:isopentenyl-diphosphate Delta-isomerase [Georgfuchsia toluolica]|uniref:isopentenyl-diphosphate Delta-isomerase n=1 Tax=Georgfuchsia toluolica TaxID=424218 RepID=UPI001C732ED9|nr:NUDIX domain-containing protein [Georgfuchsia toluolica]
MPSNRMCGKKVAGSALDRKWYGCFMGEQVILVDSLDNIIGFDSAFVFDSGDRLLLQRRASGKYHSGGLWNNTCCGHPGPNESIISVGHRRFREEKALTANSKKFSVLPIALLDNQLIENEYEHVLFGKYDVDPIPNPEELDD